MSHQASSVVAAGGLALAGLAGVAPAAQAQAADVQPGALPATPTGSIAEQRAWLLQQVRIGEATGRQVLTDNALARLRMLAPDDPDTLLAVLEVQLSQQKIEDATATFERLRQVGRDSRGMASAERLWRAFHGDLQTELQQARLLATGGHDAEALKIYRKLFNDAPPGLQIGMEYWRLRGTEARGRTLAITQLTALDRAYPGNSALLMSLARLLFATDRDDQALAVLERLGNNPDNLNLAANAEWQYLSRQPANPRSVRLLQSFIARYPGWAKIDAARARHAEQAALVSDPAWRSGLRGQQLLQVDRNEDAERAFVRALKGHPDEAEFLGGLGVAKMRLGDRAQALVYFQRAVKATTGDADDSKWLQLIESTRYWLQLESADAALAAGDLDQAGQLYEQARRQQPREVNAQLGLADVALARGDDAGAEKQLLAIRRAAPGDANAVRKLVQLYARTDPPRMEAFIGELPAAQQKLYAEDIRQLQLSRLRTQREQALAAGDVAAAIELGRQLRKELPDDPWLAYALGNELRSAGQASEGDAVVEDMAAHATDWPEARYAQALYLSGSDRLEQALAVIDALPRAQWDDDIRALSERLRRQQLLSQARALRSEGREAEAIALLQSQPADAESTLILAEWARLRSDYSQALLLYQQVLDMQPDNVDAQLGRIQSWIGAGDVARARGFMLDTPPAVSDDDMGQQRQLAAIWTDLREDRRALVVLRGILARKTAPDPQTYRDTARIVRKDDPQQALDLYATGLQENGVLSAEQAKPRDNRALTRASRETVGDDWLRSSLRSDVATLYQQQNPTLTVLQDSGRRSDGTPGISRLARDTRIAHLDLPVAGGLGWARIEQVRLDARSFEVDANGFHAEDFGSCDLDVQLADGSTLSAPGCSNRLRQRVNSGAGLAVGWRTVDDRWNFDLGHTPSGYAVGNWLGGVTYNGDLGPLGWGATASRRPMTNSLLSQAGAVDPRTGITWGGVVADGVTFSLGYDQGGRNGVWSNWSWHRLTGRNVQDNTRARAMGGWYYKLVQKPDMRLDVGASAMYWRYARDVGGYTLGQGGYYSPQRYASVSLPASFAWRSDNWSVRVDGSVSLSSARTASTRRYPLSPLLQRALASLEAGQDVVGLDPGTAFTTASSSTGTGYRLYTAVERRLGDHLVLGAAGTLQRSRDFSPSTFQLYLRYALNPWQGNLPLPVAPLVPYGEFR